MFLYEGTVGIAWAFFLPAPVQYNLYIKVQLNGKYSRYIGNIKLMGRGCVFRSPDVHEKELSQ